MIRLGIVGYGNIGKGVELAAKLSGDCEVVAVFTRRAPDKVKTVTDIPVVSYENINAYRTKIDVMILCGGSATDLPEQTKVLAKTFNCVDSYDNHNNIPHYFEQVHKAAIMGSRLCAISIGWDPGVFSITRTLFEAVLPKGAGDTFWGRGVSQGHGDAIRRVEGVQDAVQYTVPKSAAVDKVRAGDGAALTKRDKHMRECYVVSKEGADTAAIKAKIVSMPDYFADYNTVVYFVTQEQLNEKHKAMPHGGFVLRKGITSGTATHNMELSLQLDSNPEFTASILVAYARAVFRMFKEGARGAVTALDVPIGMLSQKTKEELLEKNV